MVGEIGVFRPPALRCSAVIGALESNIFCTVDNQQSSTVTSLFITVSARLCLQHVDSNTESRGCICDLYKTVQLQPGKLLLFQQVPVMLTRDLFGLAEFVVICNDRGTSIRCIQLCSIATLQSASGTFYCIIC